MPERHPLGRTCGKAMPMVLLMFIPLTIRGVYRDKKKGLKLREIFSTTQN